MAFSSGREGINLYMGIISSVLLGKGQRATLPSFGVSPCIGTNVGKGSAASFFGEQNRNNKFLCIVGKYLRNRTALHSRQAYYSHNLKFHMERQLEIGDKYEHKGKGIKPLY